MTKAETEFNEILTSIKEYLDRPILHDNDPPRNALATALHYRKQDLSQDAFLRIQIRIMESGIFYKGGLKGKVLQQTHSGRVLKWQVWPISNLPGLLGELAADLVTSEPNQFVIEHVSDQFKNLFESLSPVLHLARLAGIREGTRKKTVNELEKWNERAIKSIPKVKSKIAIEIAQTLISHLPPKTPDLTIANRINELMMAFNQESGKIETLRKMVADKRKK